MNKPTRTTTRTRTPSRKETAKDWNLQGWLPLAAVAAMFAYVVYTRQPQVEPRPQPQPTVSIESTVKSVKEANAKALADAFEDAANQVEQGKFKYARELLEYMQPITKAAREQANKPFDLMIGQTIPDELSGKEKEVAAELRRIAKAWLK